MSDTDCKTKLSRVSTVCAAVLLNLTSASADSITVQVQPTVTTVSYGETFTVELWAQIPESCAIVGWGMDVLYDPSVIGFNGPGSTNIGPQFTSQPGFGDGDGLGGLVLPPNPPVYGSVLLSAVSFTANAIGVTQIIGSYTPSDALEGFVMPGGLFAEVEFEGATVTVIPAPSALAVLLAFGSWRFGGRRRSMRG